MDTHFIYSFLVNQDPELVSFLLNNLKKMKTEYTAAEMETLLNC